MSKQLSQNRLLYAIFMSTLCWCAMIKEGQTMTMPELTAQEKAERSIKQGKMFIAQTQLKMEQLVDDFAAGKLNREQFHVLYDRYQTQINGVQLILLENDPSAWSEALDNVETIALRKKLLAKATGMVIYHNGSGTLLDSLGQFSLEGSEVSRLMTKLDAKIAKGAVTKAEVFNMTHQGALAVETSKGWAYVIKGQLVTTVTTFTHEPTKDQRETMARLHRDFENANVVHLRKTQVSVDELAMPFHVFVSKTSAR
jgi:hypothetical protein